MLRDKIPGMPTNLSTRQKNNLLSVSSSQNSFPENYTTGLRCPPKNAEPLKGDTQIEDCATNFCMAFYEADKLLDERSIKFCASLPSDVALTVKMQLLEDALITADEKTAVCIKGLLDSLRVAHCVNSTR